MKTEQITPYYVPLRKFIVLNLATAGIYSVYWAYKQWKYVRAVEEKSQAIPWLAAIFISFTYYSLLNYFYHLSNNKEPESQVKNKHLLLTFAYITLNLLGYLEGYYAVISFLSFVVLFCGVNMINKYALKLNAKADQIPKMAWWKYPLIAVGMLLSAILLVVAAVPEEKIQEFLEEEVIEEAGGSIATTFKLNGLS
jgi:hypothetical protein